MSEETKEMDELEEADKSTAKVDDHGPAIVEPDQKPKKKAGDGVKSQAKDPDTKGSASVKAESKKVKEDDEEEPESDEDEDEGEEEDEQTKKEAREVPKLKSEILAGLVDHLKGLKKEDLSKLYGTQVIGEEEGDDEDEEVTKEETEKVKESIDQKID